MAENQTQEQYHHYADLVVKRNTEQNSQEIHVNIPHQNGTREESNSNPIRNPGQGDDRQSENTLNESENQKESDVKTSNVNNGNSGVQICPEINIDVRGDHNKLFMNNHQISTQNNNSQTDSNSGSNPALSQPEKHYDPTEISGVISDSSTMYQRYTDAKHDNLGLRGEVHTYKELIAFKQEKINQLEGEVDALHKGNDYLNDKKERYTKENMNIGISIDNNGRKINETKKNTNDLKARQGIDTQKTGTLVKQIDDYERRVTIINTVSDLSIPLGDYYPNLFL